MSLSSTRSRTRAGSLLAIIATCAAAFVVLTQPLSANNQVTGTARATAAAAQPTPTAHAIFAAGCFWCVESDFDRVPGVLATTSGYTGGKTNNPSYEDHTGHVEALQVDYDPARVSYETLLDYYWRHVDLTDGNGQFCDRGPSYRPVIFTSDETQKALAEKSKKDLEDSGRFKKIAVRIETAGTFFPAEDYHQDYYKKNPLRYRYYRTGCGRDARLTQLWGAEYQH